jgi:hypothetical protein
MIPAFNASGVLPPYVGADPANRTLVSPYDVSASELVGRFATSPDRAAILAGLLTYREQLRAAGIVIGYQWLDGSFVEDIELLESRAPGDVDVVTFAYRPVAAADDASWLAFFHSNLHLFDPQALKAQLKCDAYYVDLGKRPDLVVADTSYWYGLFAHQRRSGLWKGMLRLSLNSDDIVAQGQLRGAVP